MKVRDYLKAKNIPALSGGGCPLAIYKDNQVLYKMARECCESSRTGDCVKHFLDAELGDVR